MYISAHYKDDNLEEVKTFLKENSFAILVNQHSNRITVTHIPLLLTKNTEGMMFY